MTERRKRLIEVAFPLEEVSAHSRREKNVRHGHISTLHIWWARRPLAACRAFIYESLIDDPEDHVEREQLLKEVADLAGWDAVRHPGRIVRAKEQGGSGLTGKELLDRARKRILESNGGKPPRLLDPFAGGGAIPLEALRLGCEVEASDLNPVAVLILKATVDYPQKYSQPTSREVPEYISEAEKQRRSGQSSFFDGDMVEAYGKNPLATDVRYWGKWLLDRAREELAQFFPPDADGRVPVAYLWSRTVPCPNCQGEMPLIRQYWLARKDHHLIALNPVLDRLNNRVEFEVVEGVNVVGDPGEATTTRGDTLCLLCRQVVKAEYVREYAQSSGLGMRMTAVVLEDPNSAAKAYRRSEDSDLAVFDIAVRASIALAAHTIGDASAIPDEPIDALHHDVNRPVIYGDATWGSIFNARQLVTLTTFAQLVPRAHAELERYGADPEYAKAICTYLALSVDRLADRGSMLCRWDPSPKMEALQNTFSRQALPMVWDYGEGVPLSEASGGFATCLSWIIMFLEFEGHFQWDTPAAVSLRDARSGTAAADVCLTDPPYYDAIDYSALSDFFYVWLKRSLGSLHPELLTLPLTPKRDQIVMNIYANGLAGTGQDKRAAAKKGLRRRDGAIVRSGWHSRRRNRSCRRRIRPHRSRGLGDSDRGAISGEPHSSLILAD